MIFLLLIVFQLKHFLADYPFQTQYMLGKFKGGTQWVKPLAAHAFVHAFFTLLICLVYLNHPTMEPVMLAGLDFAVHFIVDRIKAAPRLGGRWKTIQPQFWWALGADQMVHHLTHYFIIWRLVS